MEREFRAPAGVASRPQPPEFTGIRLHSPTAFHYPCAIEHEGRLLVVYTTGRTTARQCELAIIPIASLQLENR